MPALLLGQVVTGVHSMECIRCIIKHLKCCHLLSCVVDVQNLQYHAIPLPCMGMAGYHSAINALYPKFESSLKHLVIITYALMKSGTSTCDLYIR